MNVVT